MKNILPLVQGVIQIMNSTGAPSSHDLEDYDNNNGTEEEKEAFIEEIKNKDDLMKEIKEELNDLNTTSIENTLVENEITPPVENETTPVENEVQKDI